MEEIFISLEKRIDLDTGTVISLGGAESEHSRQQGNLFFGAIVCRASRDPRWSLSSHYICWTFENRTVEQPKTLNCLNAEYKLTHSASFKSFRRIELAVQIVFFHPGRQPKKIVRSPCS